MTKSPGNDAGVREALKKAVIELDGIANASDPFDDAVGTQDHALLVQIEKRVGALADRLRAALSPPTGSAGDDETVVREAIKPFAVSSSSLTKFPPFGLVNGNLYVACKNEGEGTGWRYVAIHALVSDLHRASAALTNQPPAQEPSAAGVVGDMHQAIYGEPGMPKEITPLSWLRSMLDACDTQEAVKSLGGDDPEAWGEMCGEVRAMVSALDRLTLTPAAPKTPDAGVGGARIAQALSTADWSGASIGNKALISAAIAALAQPAPVDEDETGVREALAWYGEQARLARLIHSEGDSGRHALSDDGGKRAAAALAPQPPKAETPARVGEDVVDAVAEAINKARYLDENGESCGMAYRPLSESGRSDRAYCTKLARAALSTAPAARPGDGFVLVPREPTDAMTFLGQSVRYDSAWSIGAIYRAMIAAARAEGVREGLERASRICSDDVAELRCSVSVATAERIKEVVEASMTAPQTIPGGRTDG